MSFSEALAAYCQRHQKPVRKQGLREVLIRTSCQLMRISYGRLGRKRPAVKFIRSMVQPYTIIASCNPNPFQPFYHIGSDDKVQPPE